MNSIRKATLSQYIGTSIAYQRQIAGWSQRKLAASIGCPRTVLAALEQGKLVKIPLERIYNISDVLGVGVHSIVPDTIDLDTINQLANETENHSKLSKARRNRLLKSLEEQRLNYKPITILPPENDAVTR
jgi:transcriptional regulator with XRE-family HTH domain